MTERQRDDPLMLHYRVVLLVLQDQFPKMLAPERVAAFAVTALDEAGLLTKSIEPGGAPG